MLTQQTLQELFIYDDERGVLMWRKRRNWRTPARSIAGTPHGPYWRIKVNGTLYYRHVLVWIYVAGAWPTDELDHKNHDRRDDRIDNLRPATRSQNATHKRVYQTNRLGLKGVHRVASGRYKAQIQAGGQKISLGTFDTPDQARTAYIEACQKHHGEFASP